MLRAIHALIYSDDPAATRAFFRDVLQWPSVEDPASGSGWLIFRSGPSEVGVHPTSGDWEGHTYQYPRQHRVSLVCDDIESTCTELEGRGATFASATSDDGFGLTRLLEVPGADPVMVYQPKHPTAYDL